MKWEMGFIREIKKVWLKDERVLEKYLEEQRETKTLWATWTSGFGSSEVLYLGDCVLAGIFFFLFTVVVFFKRQGGAKEHSKISEFYLPPKALPWSS